MSSSQIKEEIVKLIQTEPSALETVESIFAIIGVVITVVGVIVAVIGIWIAMKQLSKMVASLNIQRQALTASVVLECANQYDKIVSELDEALKKDQEDVWWYRFWDLFTKEYYFFTKGLIDFEIFELWMLELANVYYSPPTEGKEMKSRRTSHLEYLKSRISPSSPFHVFVNDFSVISKVICKDGISDEVVSDMTALLKRSITDKDSGRV